MSFSVSDLNKILGNINNWENLTNQFQTFKNISLDSRTILDQDLFIAIKGANFDGHDFLKEVIKKDDNFVAAIANLGILYDTQGNYEQAIKYYELAFNKDSKVTAGLPWFKRFLKNIHFKPTSVEDRLIYLKNNFNPESKDINLQNTDLDKIQPDFQM